jgi:hypothetical protein
MTIDYRLLEDMRQEYMKLFNKSADDLDNTTDDDVDKMDSLRKYIEIVMSEIQQNRELVYVPEPRQDEIFASIEAYNLFFSDEICGEIFLGDLGPGYGENNTLTVSDIQYMIESYDV